MPRNGQGVLSPPPNTTAQPNTTIASAVFNAVVDDLYQDGNAIRPQAAGGTGAATPIGAADNLLTTGANVASAASINLGLVTGISVTITGTTSISAMGNAPSGALRILTFAGVLSLVHNATNLILPGAANIVTAAGDIAMMVSLGSSRWRCIGYTKAAGVFSGPITFPGAITFTSNPVIQNSAPLLRFTDTDANTYDAQWALNSNNIYLQGSLNGSAYATKIQFELDTNNVYFGAGASLALIWNGTAVPLAVGGTGATTAAAARTNLGINAALIGSLNAGLAAGAVGTYAMAARGSGTGGALGFGDTIAGANLVSANAGSGTDQTLSGTWRCVGYLASSSSSVSTMFLRIA